MNKETIEKAAKAAACEFFSLKNEEWWARKNGFEDGAEWRINAVWHPSEQTSEAKPALVEYLHVDGGHGYLVVDDPSKLGDSITRYAYLEDLLPERKEEER